MATSDLREFRTTSEGTFGLDTALECARGTEGLYRNQSEATLNVLTRKWSVNGSASRPELGSSAESLTEDPGLQVKEELIYDLRRRSGDLHMYGEFSTSVLASKVRDDGSYHLAVRFSWNKSGITHFEEVDYVIIPTNGSSLVE